MKNFHVFSILLSAILLLVLQSERSLAQSGCHSTISGVPICTGFYLHIDTSLASRINTLKKSADSLNKEAKHLEDSLSEGWMDSKLPDKFQEQNTKPKPTPSGILSLPNTIRGFCSEINGIASSPNFELFKENNHTPIPGFKGWYYEKLADIAK